MIKITSVCSLIGDKSYVNWDLSIVSIVSLAKLDIKTSFSGEKFTFLKVSFFVFLFIHDKMTQMKKCTEKILLKLNGEN